MTGQSVLFLCVAILGIAVCMAHDRNIANSYKPALGLRNACRDARQDGTFGKRGTITLDGIQYKVTIVGKGKSPGNYWFLFTDRDSYLGSTDNGVHIAGIENFEGGK